MAEGALVVRIIARAFGRLEGAMPAGGNGWRIFCGKLAEIVSKIETERSTFCFGSGNSNGEV